MKNESLRTLFSPINDGYLNEFKAVFSSMYPLDANNGRTFNEANFTTALLKALRLSPDYKDAVSWNEFPVLRGKRIDAVVVSHSKKQIFVIESKRLRKLNKKYPDVTVSVGKNIFEDMMRAEDVANSDVFKTRICKTNNPFEAIGQDYQQYRVYGLAVCGIWTRDRKFDKDDIQRAFTKGKEEPENQPYKSLNLDSGEFFISEDISPLFPRKVSDVWQFFTLLYVWEIKHTEQPNLSISCGDEVKKRISCSMKHAPKNEWEADIDANARERIIAALKRADIHYSIRGRKNTWVYLKQDDLAIWFACKSDRNSVNFIIGTKENFYPRNKSLRDELLNRGWSERTGNTYRYLFVSPTPVSVNCVEHDLDNWLQKWIECFRQMSML